MPEMHPEVQSTVQYSYSMIESALEDFVGDPGDRQGVLDRLAQLFPDGVPGRYTMGDIYHALTRYAIDGRMREELMAEIRSASVRLRDLNEYDRDHDCEDLSSTVTGVELPTGKIVEMRDIYAGSDSLNWQRTTVDLLFAKAIRAAEDREYIRRVRVDEIQIFWKNCRLRFPAADNPTWLVFTDMKIVYDERHTKMAVLVLDGMAHIVAGDLMVDIDTRKVVKTDG